MDRAEPFVRERREGLREPGNAAEVAHRSPTRGAHVLDRRLEQALEALLDELADLGLHQLARDREVALGREPAEADRGAPQPVRVA